jgi:Xaa-Pro aminopeptidase
VDPLGEPVAARVDAGTVELVRSVGVDVRASADLVQRFEAVWSAEQFDSHARAARGLVTRHPAIVAAGPHSADPHYSEINAFVDGRALLVTGQPVQTAVVPILGEPT